jgi:signal transduction histidine kinase
MAAATIGATSTIDEHDHVARPTRPPVLSIARTILRAPFRARTWKEAGYLFVASLISGAGSMPIAALLAPTIALAILLVLRPHPTPWAWLITGLLLLVLVLTVLPLLGLVVLAARYATGAAHRGLAAALLDEHVPEPPAHPPLRRTGFLGWLRWSLGDGPGWRALAFLLLSAPITAVGFYVMMAMLTFGLVNASYPVWWQVFDPRNTDSSGRVRHSGMQYGDWFVDTWPRALLMAAIGVTLLLAVPWVVRAVVGVDRVLVRSLLGPGRTAARLRALEETRTQAVDDSAATLRRIERDLHDGTQARLVALAMQLDMAREQLPGDASPRVRELVETAHRNATEAITELRQVTRSIHPPILDRGLDAALATLAAGSAVPTLLHTDIRTRPSAAIETIAYFCVAELLANVAKHSRARQAVVFVGPGEQGLRIAVRDDGVGGARVDPSGSGSGGLAGLSDRLRTVDGRLSVDSPAGGPTVVTVDLPTTTHPGGPR